MKLRITLPGIALLVALCLGGNSRKASVLELKSDTLLLKPHKDKGVGLCDRLPIPLKKKEITKADELLELMPTRILNPKLA